MAQKRIHPRPRDETEEYARVTLPLATDTMAKIREMAVNGRYGAQGRTVDALIEAVWDSRQHIENFVKAAVAQSMLQGGVLTPAKGQEEQLQKLSMIQALNAAVIIDRLRKFVGVDPNALGEALKAEMQARAALAPPKGTNP